MHLFGWAPLATLAATPAALLAASASGAAKEGGGGMLEMLAGLGIYIPLVVANLVIFLAFFFILRTVLFERVRGHMRARDAELGKDKDEVEALEGARAGVEHQLDEAKRGIERDAHERTQEQVRKGLARKAEIVHAAQEEALERVRTVRAECEALEGRLATEGRGQIVDLALAMVRIATAETLPADKVRSAVERGIEARLAAGRSA